MNRMTSRMAKLRYEDIDERFFRVCQGLPPRVVAGWLGRLRNAFTKVEESPADLLGLLVVKDSFDEIVAVMEGELRDMPRDVRCLLRFDAYVSRFCDQVNSVLASSGVLKEPDAAAWMVR